MTKQATLARLMRAMIKYDCGDVPRIQHFVKVHNFARIIGIAEGLGEEELFEKNHFFRRFWHSAVSDGLFRQGVFPPNQDCRAKR